MAELVRLGVEEQGYTPEKAKVVAGQCFWLDHEAETEDMSDIDKWL